MSLAGIAEADEPSSSDRSKARSAECRVRLASGAVRHRSAVCLTNQIPVLICRDRTGSTADFVLDKADKEHIGAALKLILAKDAILCTDSGKVLGAAARGMGITHRPVNLAAGVRVIAGVYHVQNVNAYDSRLKKRMRPSHGAATRYLGNYMG